MKKAALLPLWICLVGSSPLWAQKIQIASIEGTVVSSRNGEAIAGAQIQITERSVIAYTDALGHFELHELKPGLINVTLTTPGFEMTVVHEVLLQNHKPVVLSFRMTPILNALDEVTITADAFVKTSESPVSLKNMGYAEMYRMPGATLDLSKAVQAYPGILPKSSFGYNLSIRGGASSENLYTLDGIEIPGINHFSIQGASGGPTGLVNMDFVKGVDIFTGAFSAARGNALSGVMDIHQKDARTDRWGARFTLGSTDYGATGEGPLGKTAGLMVSARNSFSQHYFKLFNIPVLPTYQDMQFRLKIKPNAKSEWIITGIGGNDKYRLFLGGRGSDALLYNIGYIPQGEQKLGAIGVNYKHFATNGYWNAILSMDGFTNHADKFLGNTDNEADRTLRYRGKEVAQRMRFERTLFYRQWEVRAGANAALRHVATDVWSRTYTQGKEDTAQGITSFSFLHYGTYVNATLKLAEGRLKITPGIRMDGWSYNAAMANPLRNLSPRVAVSYYLNPYLTVNASVGRYHQAPPAVLLAYTDMADARSPLRSMRNTQGTFGLEYRKLKTYRVGAEVYYKKYTHYPFLLNDSLSYANALAAFVAVGNQPANSTSDGVASGLEVYVQRKLERGFFWMLSYTYGKSQFQSKEGKRVASVWDSRHFMALNVGKTWGKGWQWGVRWRYSSGTPYTPYDTVASSLKAQWDVTQRGVFDYDRLNEERLHAYSPVDFRIDKVTPYKRWNLTWFLDLANVTSSSIPLMPYLTLVRDAEGLPVTNPTDPSRYLLKSVRSDTGRMMPSLGLILDF